jgi:hypothetical protein
MNKDFGGLIKLRLPSGENLTVRGSVSHNPLAYSAEAVVNHDGSADRTITPTGYRGTMSLSNKDSAGRPVDLAAVYALQNATFSVLHEGEKTIRTYSGACFTGDPSVDDLSGEISGIAWTATGMIASAA